MTVFDLACLPNGELSALVISQFYEGLMFKINEITYTVHKIGNLNKVKNSTITHRQRIIIKKSTTNKNITGYYIIFGNGNSMYYGNDSWNNLSRDIEGLVNIDLININNTFHDKSMFYKLAEKGIKSKQL